MWPFKRAQRDTTHQQPGSVAPARPRVRGRWRPIVLITLALLIGAFLGAFCVDRMLWAGDDRLTGTIWRHQDDKATVTIEFGRLWHVLGNPVVRYTRTEGSASGRGSVTYRAADEKTLSLAGGKNLTIDNLSNEQLILSGGDWKFDKTEFRRQR